MNCQTNKGVLLLKNGYIVVKFRICKVKIKK